MSQLPLRKDSQHSTDSSRCPDNSRIELESPPRLRSGTPAPCHFLSCFLFLLFAYQPAISTYDVENGACSRLTQGKRVFIKDMAYYWMPPKNQPPQIAPSLVNYKRGVGTDTTQLAPAPVSNGSNGSKAEIGSSGKPYPYPTEAEAGNPTVLPKDLLSQFHFTFLIRHPKHSIPSFHRCTTPPLDTVTGWSDVGFDETGYAELRRLFDYLRAEGLVGPRLAGESANGTNGDHGKDSGVEICVLDADDVLDNPTGMIEAYCKSTGIPYEPEMLKWDGEYHQKYAREAFEKWRGWHEDAINSDELKARTHVSLSPMSFRTIVADPNDRGCKF